MTDALKLPAIRSLFAFLKACGMVKANPASTELLSVQIKTRRWRGER